MSMPTDFTPEAVSGVSTAGQPQAQRATVGGEAPLMPSEVVQPKRTDTLPQQAATQPGDGSEEHARQPKFGERVIGVAQKTRGTILNKPELKEHGEKVLEGQASAKDPKKEL